MIQDDDSQLVALDSSAIPLLSACGGCAAKYPARRLQELLATLPEQIDEALLVGLAPSDDAAVYRLDDDRAVVFTLDFFPPIVADPADFGAIAAANALSDVFAMGGTPLLALSIAVFPESLDSASVRAIFAAAAEQVSDAGAVLAGGHTLRDDEPKYGLAVVGTVDPDSLWTKAAAKPEDLVYLTKPLGTGLIVQAESEGRAEPAWLQSAVRWMRTLNMQSARLLQAVQPNAVTDVTGFGLLGHALEVAERSAVRIELDAGALPALPGAAEVAQAGMRSGGHARNLDFVVGSLECTGVGDVAIALGLDPQTSGGLLVTIPTDRASLLESEFAEAGAFLQRVGVVRDGTGVALI